MKHILVLYNLPVLAPDHPDAVAESETIDTARIVAEALAHAGYRVSRLGLGADPSPLLDFVKGNRPDAVFNLFEGLATQSGTEPVVAGLLEWLGLPFTGSPQTTLLLCRDKTRAKLLMQGAGIPTPAFLSVTRLPMPAWPNAWPVIVKPGTEDASVGLDQNSVVGTQQKLAERVALLLQRYGPPILVEEYIDGREFNLAVLADPEPRVLPIAEIVFDKTDPSCWPIVTYDAKWKPESRDFIATPPKCPANVEPVLAESLSRLALRAFELFGCRQHVRLDFRVNHRGEPFLLEVNPNPDIHPTAGLALAESAAGLAHHQLVAKLVTSLLDRGSDKSFALPTSGW
jgi:D-alanine-D-alanine ligase